MECESIAESIFTNKILKPKCDEVLSRKGNATALLDCLETFITSTPLIQVSQEMEHLPWMKNYDFILRGIFPYVTKLLSQKFPGDETYIWSPSTPDSFHSNWTRCERFIMNLEASAPSLTHLENFRNSEIFKEFIGKWQFNAYYQLR